MANKGVHYLYHDQTVGKMPYLEMLKCILFTYLLSSAKRRRRVWLSCQPL